MKWYFVRHGEIESNIRKVYAGWSDERLTARGRKQAVATARRLKEIDFSDVYASPIRRTMETAGIIGDTLGFAPIPDDGFKELKMGPWEGLSEHEVADRYPDQWEIWNTRPAELAVDGRETLQEVLERVLYGINKIKEKEPDGSILVITHVAIIRVLILHAENRDLNEYKQVPVPGNGEVLEIAFGS
ncbi:MAG: histidine phosphatase family protein [Deltaproteobacteria bacterium]|jgi:broad specificity phosphatase PhoE|nr:histidine phosphatase family protein [Deltaproteobacteria bacterium]